MSFEQAIVVKIMSPSQFYIVRNMSAQNYRNFKKEIKATYKSEIIRPPTVANVGERFVALTSDGWYRAEVISTMPDGCSVRLIDHGLEMKVSLNRMKVLLEHHKTIGPLAEKCTQVGIWPKQEMWSAAVIRAFANAVPRYSERTFITVIGSGGPSGLHVGLFVQQRQSVLDVAGYLNKFGYTIPTYVGDNIQSVVQIGEPLLDATYYMRCNLPGSFNMAHFELEPFVARVTHVDHNGYVYLLPPTIADFFASLQASIAQVFNSLVYSSGNQYRDGENCLAVNRGVVQRAMVMRRIEAGYHVLFIDCGNYENIPDTQMRKCAVYNNIAIFLQRYKFFGLQPLNGGLFWPTDVITFLRNEMIGNSFTVHVMIEGHGVYSKKAAHFQTFTWSVNNYLTQNNFAKYEISRF